MRYKVGEPVQENAFVDDDTVVFYPIIDTETGRAVVALPLYRYPEHAQQKAGVMNRRPVR